MKINYKKIFLIVTLLLIVGFGLENKSAQAATSTKTKKVYVGTKVSISTPSKSKWKSSKKSVIKLSVSTSKKTKTVTATAKKAGKATVTAKCTNGYTYKWSITVKKKTTSVASASRSSSVVSLKTTSISGSQDSYYTTTTGVKVRGYFDTTMASEIASMTSQYRAQKGKSTLSTQTSLLTQAAKVRAVECASVGAISHTRPNGLAYYTVGGTASKSYEDSVVMGENLAMGYYSASEVMSAWKNSSSHKANMLDSRWGSIGVAVFMIKQSSGDYYPYLVQEFGY